MTKHLVARMDRRTVRFFTGRYHEPKVTFPLSPKTTARLDKARAYDDQAVAAFICSALNRLASVKDGQRAAPWAVMPAPEAQR